MSHWLMKSEPDSWSWEQMVAAGKKGTHWNGVRNHTAKRNMQAMALGDEVVLLPFERGQGDRRHRRR